MASSSLISVVFSVIIDISVAFSGVYFGVCTHSHLHTHMKALDSLAFSVVDLAAFNMFF